VVARLANSLGNELVKAETAKAARSQNPNAVDFTLRGEAFHGWGDPDDVRTIEHEASPESSSKD
jgi:hypothetical protein